MRRATRRAVGARGKLGCCVLPISRNGIAGKVDYFVCPDFHRRLPISVTVFISSEGGGCFDEVFRNGGRFRASIRALISFRAVCSIVAGTMSAATGLRTASCTVLGACDFGVPPGFRRFIGLLHVEDCVPT